MIYKTITFKYIQILNNGVNKLHISKEDYNLIVKPHLKKIHDNHSAIRIYDSVEKVEKAFGKVHSK